MTTTAPIQTNGAASHLVAGLAITQNVADNSLNRDSEGDDRPIAQVAIDDAVLERSPGWTDPNHLPV